ncbi:type II secretion system F family protein [Patescibacteria group bacterium]|nr:type II secretion system F family protein [Patescibacteria group bacterium]MBU1931710.1 type II secretion system F family protein [Patescibacteria group bacterium]
MKKFNYKAKNKQGKTITGLIEANNDQSAVKILRERGLLTLSLKEYREGISLVQFFPFLQKISKDDLVNFTRQLSTMITAGLPLTDALTILQMQGKPAFAEVVGGVLKDVEGGESLAKSLEKYPKVFPNIYIALVRSGEAAGVLDTILARLADNLEKQKEFRTKTRGAMIYPAIIVTGMLIVAVIMIIFVIPKLTSLYAEFEADLPIATELLLKLSDFMVKSWYLFLLLIIGAVTGFRRFYKTAAGKKIIDRQSLRLPIFGKLKTKVILAEFTRTLSLLINAGVAIIDSLNIVASVAGNVIFEASIRQIAKKVEKGTPLANALAQEEVFPQLVSQMISVGEETGKVDEILNKLSHYFETEAEAAIKGLTTAIEPLMMALLGVGVGFLVIAVIMPIYNLTSQF